MAAQDVQYWLVKYSPRTIRSAAMPVVVVSSTVARVAIITLFKGFRKGVFSHVFLTHCRFSACCDFRSALIGEPPIANRVKAPVEKVHYCWVLNMIGQ